MQQNQIANSDSGNQFKVVGYYPCWVPGGLNKIDFSIVTHINYAFVIPTEDGHLLPLRNPDLAKKIINSAHEHGVKVMIVVGGWDYNDIPLEKTFAAATDTPEKAACLADELIALCDEYHFDGIDVDWEHPRLNCASAKQYEAFMLDLSHRLHRKGKLLTAAVISGASADGGILHDAAAQSDNVLNACDWINIMAYDGGEDIRHSTYDFAVNCGNYWKNSRCLPSSKVVLGVPFYARPTWGTYENILLSDPNAHEKDLTVFHGIESHYNGIATIQKKTSYAKENLGGIMIWELTQDSLDKDKSLLSAIGKIAQ